MSIGMSIIPATHPYQLSPKKAQRMWIHPLLVCIQSFFFIHKCNNPSCEFLKTECNISNGFHELDAPNFDPKWNEIDGKIDRRPIKEKYKIKDKYPINFMGRTGAIGKGEMKCWGPNNLAYIIFTRYETTSIDHRIVMDGHKK